MCAPKERMLFKPKQGPGEKLERGKEERNFGKKNKTGPWKKIGSRKKIWASEKRSKEKKLSSSLKKKSFTFSLTHWIWS